MTPEPLGNSMLRPFHLLVRLSLSFGFQVLQLSYQSQAMIVVVFLNLGTLFAIFIHMLVQVHN